MIKDRIQELIKALNISGREFNRRIGKSNSWNRTIGKSIGADIVSNISTTFPQVNIDWLIRGEGEMFIEDTPQEVNEDQGSYRINKDYKAICEDLRNDNKELRDENRKLRDTLLELMYKNEKLMIENAQLKAKIAKE